MSVNAPKRAGHMHCLWKSNAFASCATPQLCDLEGFCIHAILWTNSWFHKVTQRCSFLAMRAQVVRSGISQPSISTWGSFHVPVRLMFLLADWLQTSDVWHLMDELSQTVSHLSTHSLVALTCALTIFSEPCNCDFEAATSSRICFPQQEGSSAGASYLSAELVYARLHFALSSKKNLRHICVYQNGYSKQSSHQSRVIRFHLLLTINWW